MQTLTYASKITPAQIAIIRDEWNAMLAFLGLPPDTDPNTTTTMNTIIDLTTAQSAFNYLRSLPADQAINLPGHYTENTTEGDAVRAITDQSAHEWAGNRRQWEWTAADLVATLEAEMAESEANRETLAA